MAKGEISRITAKLEVCNASPLPTFSNKKVKKKDMIKLELNEQETAILKGLLIQLMANQPIMDGQRIVDNAQNCLFFIQKLAPKAEQEINNKTQNNTTP